MGGQISIRCGCCSGKTEGNDNFDEEVEDKITLAQQVENEKPQIRIPNIIQQQPVLERSWSETTLHVR
jgi:hypothetical protein